jgi:RNA polymerase sigma factor (sigma-70 family)
MRGGQRLKKKLPDKYDWNTNPEKTLYERFEDNRKLVPSTIIRCFPSRCDDEDFAQEGYIALWHAVQTYDPTIGVRFSTYAGRVIHNHCVNYLIHQSAKNRPTEELDENAYDEEQYLLFDEIDFDIDSVARKIGEEAEGVSPAARSEIAVVAKDRYLGKPSDVTCAEQGWKYRRYHERLMQLKKTVRRRKYTNL